MLNRKKLQQVLFLLMFVNCCIVVCITSISIGTDYWVTVRPYRQVISTVIFAADSNNEESSALAGDSVSDDGDARPVPVSVPVSAVASMSRLRAAAATAALQRPESDAQSSMIMSSGVSVNNAKEYSEYFTAYSPFASSSEEEDSSMPADLDAKRDCKRYTGKIRFGLFKGVWLLNYAYGCRNRASRVSIIDILLKHKIFDQTLWISTILCCALALFSTVISAIFSLVNIFLSPNRAINGPVSMYLWNSLAGLFHVLALLLFTLEFHLFIKKNVLSKEELESGWVSTNLAQLGWSFYLLCASVALIYVNIALIYGTVRLKRLSSADFDGKTAYETRLSLINRGGAGDTSLLDGEHAAAAVTIRLPDYQEQAYEAGDATIQKLNELSQYGQYAASNSQLSLTLQSHSQHDSAHKSHKLKRIIDFIY